MGATRPPRKRERERERERGREGERGRDEYGASVTCCAGLGEGKRVKTV